MTDNFPYVIKSTLYSREYSEFSRQSTFDSIYAVSQNDEGENVYTLKRDRFLSFARAHHISENEKVTFTVIIYRKNQEVVTARTSLIKGNREVKFTFTLNDKTIKGLTPLTIAVNETKEEKEKGVPNLGALCDTLLTNVIKHLSEKMSLAIVPVSQGKTSHTPRMLQDIEDLKGQIATYEDILPDVPDNKRKALETLINEARAKIASLTEEYQKKSANLKKGRENKKAKQAVKA